MTNKNKLYNHVKYLSRIKPYRNYKNLKSLKKISDYIKTEFNSYNLTSTEQKWKVKYYHNKEYSNVIASYNPDKSKRLIIGAHYDVCCNQPGADDNASGIAGLLETARLISTNKPDIDFRIDFVAYCLEEPPFFATEYMGSYIHAKSMYENNIDIIGMLCYEMIGYFSKPQSNIPDFDLGISQVLPKEFLTSYDYIGLVSIKKYEKFANDFYNLMKNNSEIEVKKSIFEDEYGFAGLSDNLNYFKFDYSAVMITDTGPVRNTYYHTKQDIIETLDFDKMSQVIDGVYKSVIKI